MKNINLIFLWVFSNCFLFIQAQTIDTIFLKKSLGYNIQNSFVQFDKNTLEWYDKEAIYPFFEKLKNAKNKKVKILHIGDSHIQPDICTGVTRNKLQQVFGYGGRGLVFPYQVAGTASAYDYTAYGTGNWISSKNVEYKPKLNLGLTGISIFTKDSTAGFKIIFKNKHATIRSEFRKIKVYCHKSPESFSLKVSTNSSGYEKIIDVKNSDGLPYIEFELPKSSDSLIFKVAKTAPNQNFFECYGVEIENIEDEGVEYFSVGIAGAAYQSIFYQNKMKEQLEAIQPDLVIFDLGVNNFFKGPFDYQFVMGCLNQMIDFVRKTCPNASFLLPNSQDIYYKNRNVVNCMDYSLLTRLVAKEQKVALYDYFNITGGLHSMLNWSKDGLSNKDQCHLSGTGYRFKGELLFNGIMNGYLTFLNGKKENNLVFEVNQDTLNNRKWVIDKSIAKSCKLIEVEDKLTKYNVENFNQPQKVNVTKITKVKDVVIYVKEGDTLQKLATKNNISVEELKRLNSLKSDKLIIGQKLKIKQL
jgi:LysM repeat protein